ncbi:MAG: choice-of-anchor Q domain-containing protein [Tahibacter sp.]
MQTAPRYLQRRLTIAIVVCAFASPAMASTILVSTTADSVANDGQCSLREAITSANTGVASGAAAGECAAPPAQTAVEIRVPTGTFRITRSGTQENNNLNGDFDIRRGTLQIIGAGAGLTTIRGDRDERVFDLPVIVSPPPLTGPVVEFSDLTIRDGSAPFGGAIAVQGGYLLQIRRCAIVNNDAGYGGAIASFNDLIIDASTFHANATTDAAGLGGGALYHSGASATLRNTTFNANESLTYGSAAFFDGAATLNHVTAAENIADSDFNGSGGAAVYINQPVNIANTLISGNVDLGIVVADPAMPDCFSGPAQLTSQGYNLIGNSGAACMVTSVQASDQIGTPAAPINAQLLPLAPYGGPTDTQLPAARSPAVDRGAPLLPAGPYACLSVDQRGVARPIGARCDIGAAESDDRIFADDFEIPPA